MSNSPDDERPPSYLRASWRAFLYVLEDYHWVTKALALVLVACCVLGVAAAYWGDGVLAGLMRDVDWRRVERVLTSDSFRMLLTLAIALLIAVSIKRRQAAGLLDGDEHYNIGRALAFGYFKNFLVGTLILAAEKGRTLYIFKPDNVADLRTFEHEVWPEIARKLQTRTEEVRPDTHRASAPLVRRVVVIGSASTGGDEFWMDFPTTLFTVGDYYESWNRWLADNDRPLVHQSRLLKFEQTQIDEFFRHLRLLMTSGIGRKAVEDFGLTQDELIALQEKCYVELSLSEFRARLEQAEVPEASEHQSG